MRWWCAATGAEWTWRWTPYPGVWLFLLSLAGVYTALARSARAEGGPVTRAEVLSLVGGLLVLWIALDWPVGPMGAGYLASVHMAQFLLIGVLAPPLLLHGVPEAAYRRLERRPRLLGAIGRLTQPLVALAIFAVSMAVTHWPRVVDSLMTGQLGSFALDMIWLGTGLVFAWPLVAPVPERAWMTYPVKIGILLAASIVNTGVFAFLTFSSLPVYAIYELAPPITGLTAREDQLIAGLLMKMGGAPILWIWVSILFFRWFRESEREDEAEKPAVAPAGGA